MKVFENEKISIRQLQCLIILNTFGLSALTLPRTAAELSGSGLIPAIAIASAVMSIFALIYCEAGARLNIAALCETAAGRVLCLLYCIKLIAVTCLSLRLFYEMLQKTALYTTPIWLTSALVIICGAYCASKGYECRARVGEMLLVLVFIPLIFVLAVTAASTSFSRLSEIQFATPASLSGGLRLCLAFSGLELIIFASPHVNGKSPHTRAAASVVFLGAIFIFNSVLALARFGLPTLLTKPYPFVQVIDTLDFPGAFIERQDIIVLWFSIASAFSIAAAASFFPRLILFRHSGRMPVAVTAAILYAGVLALENKSIQGMFEFAALYGGILFMFIVPLILFAASRRVKKNENS